TAGSARPRRLAAGTCERCRHRGTVSERRRLEPRVRLRERAADRRAVAARARLDSGLRRPRHGPDGRRRQRAGRRRARRVGLRHAQCARRRAPGRTARRELAAARSAGRARGGTESLGVLTAATPAASHRVGLVLLATVVFAWGLTWPVNKVIVATVPPLWAVAIRAAIGALALVILALATGRLAKPPRADLPVLLSIALLHMVG